MNQSRYTPRIILDLPVLHERISSTDGNWTAMNGVKRKHDVCAPADDYRHTNWWASIFPTTHSTNRFMSRGSCFTGKLVVCFLQTRISTLFPDYCLSLNKFQNPLLLDNNGPRWNLRSSCISLFPKGSLASTIQFSYSDQNWDCSSSWHFNHLKCLHILVPEDDDYFAKILDFTMCHLPQQYSRSSWGWALRRLQGNVIEILSRFQTWFFRRGPLYFCYTSFDATESK